MFGVISTGANNDLVGSTELARKMVREWGMSDAHRADGVGLAGPGVPRRGPHAHPRLLRRDRPGHRRRGRAHPARAGGALPRDLLTEHRKGLDLVARALLEHETIDGAEVTRLITLAGGGLGSTPAGDSPATTATSAHGIDIGPGRGPDAPVTTPSDALTGSQPAARAADLTAAAVPSLSAVSGRSRWRRRRSASTPWSQPSVGQRAGLAQLGHAWPTGRWR